MLDGMKHFSWHWYPVLLFILHAFILHYLTIFLSDFCHSSISKIRDVSIFTYKSLLLVLGIIHCFISLSFQKLSLC